MSSVLVNKKILLTQLNLLYLKNSVNLVPLNIFCKYIHLIICGINSALEGRLMFYVIIIF